jgi:hypothetical protein
MTPSDLPGFWQRTGGTPGQTSLEADEAENANPKIIVQRQQGCELLTCSNVVKPYVVVARRVLDNDMIAVGVDGARPRYEIDPGKFSSLRIAVRRSDKDNGRRQEFGPPYRRVEVRHPRDHVTVALAPRPWPRPGPPHIHRRMIRIATTPAAFEAIVATMPLGSVGFENATNEKGERYVWLPPNVVDRLKAMRGPGESYSDIILRLAKA